MRALGIILAFAAALWSGRLQAQHYIGVRGGWGGGSVRFQPVREGMEKTGADSGSGLDERIAAAVRKQADSLREEFSTMSAKDLESRMDGFREEITAQTRAAADESLRETGDSLRRLAGAISLLEEKIGKIQTEQQHLSDRLTSVENVISGPALEKTAAAACARVLREELARLMSGEK